MDDDLISCPYNSEHRIVRYRLPYHIIKCKKQHMNKQLEPCPFNATHLINKTEMTAHIKECPDYLITVENEMVKTYASSRTAGGSSTYRGLQMARKSNDGR